MTEKNDVLAVKSWLSKTISNWILVLDDVNSALEIVKYLPTTPDDCVVLITSTSRVNKANTITGTRTLEVARMTNSEALKLFAKAARLDLDNSDEKAEAENLVADLGRYALAVDLAGSYIANNGIPIAEYRKIFSADMKFSLTSEGVTSRTGYTKQIFRPWEITLDQICALDEGHGSHAISLSNFFSLLHPQRIPTRIVKEAWKNFEENHLGLVRGQALDIISKTKQEVMIEPLVRNAVGRLTAYSMVYLAGKRSERQSYVSMPPLIHRWTRERMSETDRRDQWTKAMITIAMAVSAQSSTAKHRHDMLPHIDHLINLYRNDLFTLPCGPQLCQKIVLDFSNVYSEAGLVLKAKDLRGWVLEKTCELLPQDPIAYVQASQHLARSHSDLGEYDDARRILRDLIGRLRAGNSGDTLLLLSCWSDLSDCLEESNLPEDALQERGLIMERFTKSRYDETFRSEINRVQRKLAASKRDASKKDSGEIDHAISILQECIQSQEQYAQMDDHDLLVSFSELAKCYEDRGDLSKAQELNIKVLERRKDGDHSTHDIMTAKDNVAALYSHQHQYELALALREEIMDTWNHQLLGDFGDLHPNYLKARSNLARSLADNGLFERSYLEFFEVVPKYCDRYGDNDPATLNAKYHLAMAQKANSDVEAAHATLQDVVAEWAKWQEERPNQRSQASTFAQNELANIYRLRDNPKKSLQMRHDILVEQQSMGYDESEESTLRTKYELFVDYARVGEYDIAVGIGEQVYDAVTQKLSPHHWLRVDTCLELFRRYRRIASQASGPPDEFKARSRAVHLLEEAYQIQEANQWQDACTESISKLSVEYRALGHSIEEIQSRLTRLRMQH